MLQTLLRTRLVVPHTIKRTAYTRFSQPFHTATGRLITVSPQGTPVSQDVEVDLGDAGNTFVMFDPEIGQAFKAALPSQQGGDPSSRSDKDRDQDPDSYSLRFYHDTRHFSHESSSYPRLEIPQDLPRQSSEDSSPATLTTCGVSHAITLDGTADAAFEQSLRESVQQLRPVLERLKDQ